MRSVTLILIYLTPFLVHQLEIFGTGSGHVSGREVFFFKFILKVALFSLQMIRLNLKVPQSKMHILNLIDISPPRGHKNGNKSSLRSSFQTVRTHSGKYVRLVGLIFVLGCWSPEGNSCFFAYADSIPTMINTDVLPAGQRDTLVFCLGSLASMQKCLSW